MTTANPFDLLGDFDNDDPFQIIAKVAPPQPVKKALAPSQTNSHPPSQAKLPSKPLPPAQLVREAKKDLAGGRGGGGGGGGRGYGPGRGGFSNRDSYARNNENRGISNGVSEGYELENGGMGEHSLERPRGVPAPFRGGRRGGFHNGELSEGERPRRIFDRHSATGRRNDIKRDGAGRGNWGTVADQTPIQESEELVNQSEKSIEKNFSDDKLPGNEDGEALSKENPPAEQEEKEPEDKEMTLEEYEKVLEEKRKALQALRRTEERKVDLDSDLKSMLLLSSKKDNDDVFIKLGSEKDLAKRKDLSDKEEKAKKSLSINEFLKPAEGERQHYGPGGRGGRGRGVNRGGFRGGGFAGEGGMNRKTAAVAPSIKDPGQFPTLPITPAASLASLGVQFH